MKRKFLAALLALVMVFSMIPVSASAAEDGEYDIVRLMNQEEWRNATFARAGIERNQFPAIQYIDIYNDNDELLNVGVPAPFLTPDCFYTDTFDVAPDEISRIVVGFTHGANTVEAVFTREDFEVTGTGGVAATKHLELSLTEHGKSVPSGHAVRFYAELNDETTYTLYDTVYVQDGQQIGNQMPNDPPVGSYVFLGWQTEKDGGTAVGSETYVYGDMDVYAAKGTAEEGHAQEYHVMSATEKRSNALAIEVADHYNAEKHTSFGVESFTIDDIAVNGTNTTTNYQYHTDEWKNEHEYYYIYNVTAWAANVTPEYKNERVPVNDVTGITVYGKLNGNDYSAFIPRSELELVETQNNVVVEIRVREKLDGISKELVTTETVDVLTGAGITIPAPGEIVSVPADGTVTLMYKITVTGDSGSAYKITDEGAAVVDGYSLTGTIDHTGTATIYVTKTFTSSDVKNGSLINTASVVPGDDTTLGTDENQGSASDDVGAEVDDGEEDPDSNFVTQYWVMNDLDVIEKVFSAKEPDKELAGIELGTSTGIATDGETLGNGWNNSEDKLYYIVSNGKPNGNNYVPWKEVSRLTFLYENGSNGITNLDIRVEEPDENGISKVYLLYDVRYNFNNGTTIGWKHTDSTKNWASASTYTVVTPTSPYLTPPNGDGREVELIGWSQTQHNTIFEPNAELPDHLTAGGTFTVDPNAENTNNTSLMINLYAVWAYKDTSTEPTPEPTPDPDPTPDPTPTPGPGGGDKPPYIPPYIPPVDPDDSGVSDLLNTDDHIQYLFGYPEGTFGPENNMTRAEVAQMFYNLLLDQDVTITKTFDDVPANAWYAKAVNTLASLGVVSGVGNGDFEPERSITRAEFTSIAMKFAEGKTGGTNIFSDVKSTDWFYRAVVNSTQYGWIHGYGDGTFRPNNPITRVEVTAIVNNMLGREADVDFVTEHYDELNHFSDLVVSHWGYYHIVEATNDHDYTKPSSGENWTELN